MSAAVLRPASARPRETVVKWLTAVTAFLAVTVGWTWGSAAWRGQKPLPGLERPSGPCTLWFVGSSTIARWTTLSDRFAPWDARRRGVEGARLGELVPRLVADDAAVPPPAALVIYVGDNDIAAGASAADAFAGLQRMIALRDERFGPVPTFVLAIKPSPARWRFRAEQLRYDAMVRALAARRRDIRLIPVAQALLQHGRPAPALFESDGVHLAAAGYRRWGAAVRAGVDAGLPASTRTRCERP